MRTNILLQILKVLTSNSETPYLIWDNSTRAELIDYLETQRQSVTEEADPAFGAGFIFSAHKDELKIGGIFIRIYNEQPTYPLEVYYYFYHFLLVFDFFFCV